MLYITHTHTLIFTHTQTHIPPLSHHLCQPHHIPTRAPHHPSPPPTPPPPQRGWQGWCGQLLIDVLCVHLEYLGLCSIDKGFKQGGGYFYSSCTYCLQRLPGGGDEGGVGWLRGVGWLVESVGVGGGGGVYHV